MEWNAPTITCEALSLTRRVAHRPPSHGFAYDAADSATPRCSRSGPRRERDTGATRTSRQGYWQHFRDW